MKDSNGINVTFTKDSVFIKSRDEIDTAGYSFDEKKIRSIVPAENIKLKTIVFCNKYFLKLRIYNLLSFLPLRLWRLADKMANAIAYKPVSFVIKIIKTD